MNYPQFEDQGPLRLRARDTDDLKIISMFIQDAVFKRSDITWNARSRDLALLINRFRWESEIENKLNTAHERVKSVLMISDILNINVAELTGELTPNVFSCLELRFQPKEDTTGRMELVLSGDREIIMEVECIEVSLTDVTEPYPAAAKEKPSHK